jgi:hypothetical protein
MFVTKLVHKVRFVTRAGKFTLVELGGSGGECEVDKWRAYPVEFMQDGLYLRFLLL